MAPRGREARNWVPSVHSLSQPLLGRPCCSHSTSAALSQPPHSISVVFGSGLDYHPWPPTRVLLLLNLPKTYCGPLSSSSPTPLLLSQLAFTSSGPPTFFLFHLCTCYPLPTNSPLVTFFRALSPASSVQIVPLPHPFSLSIIQSKGRRRRHMRGEGQ